MPAPQREMPLFAAVRRPKLVPWELIHACRDTQDAARLCVHMSGTKDVLLCQRLGVDKGHWSRIMRGQAHFPLKKLPQLMQEAGNLAVVQYLALAMGLRLQADVDRIAELEAELAVLRSPSRKDQSTQISPSYREDAA